MIYAIVEHTTGKIVQSGVASDLECLSPMLQENQVAIEIDSTADNTKFVVIDGRLEQLPERPSSAHIFDYTTKQWVDPRTLSDLQVAKWEQIKRARVNAEFGGFTWDGSPFDSDAISQSRIRDALQLAALIPDFSIDWTLADNTVRALSGSELVAVGVALGLHVGTQHAKARTLRAQIEAATTADEVDAVTW